MDMGSLRQELQLPHHFIMGGSDLDLDEDIMMLGSTPQVHHQPVGTFDYSHAGIVNTAFSQNAFDKFIVCC